MGDIYPRKVECPHCKAINESWGWARYCECSNCHRQYEVKLQDPSEGVVKKTIEKIDGIWDDQKKDAECV